MLKAKALELFGGTVALAKAVGVTHGAVSQWPDVLPQRIADRVIAACVRRGIDPSLLIASEKEAA